MMRFVLTPGMLEQLFVHDNIIKVVEGIRPMKHVDMRFEPAEETEIKPKLIRIFEDVQTNCINLVYEGIGYDVEDGERVPLYHLEIEQVDEKLFKLAVEAKIKKDSE
jgi:hypothetical protein